MRWSCGVFCGFVLALITGAVLFYFFYLKKNPEVAADGMNKIENQWDKTKNSGDRVIQNMKPLVPESKTIKNTKTQTTEQ